MQQLLFDNANEKAFGGSIAYDFGSVGLSGLSAGVWYTRGWGAINSSTNAAIPDQRELDLWIQYRPTEGPLKGFRLKTHIRNCLAARQCAQFPTGTPGRGRLYRANSPTCRNKIDVPWRPVRRENVALLGRSRIALCNSAIQRRLASVRPRTAFGGLPAVHLPKLHSHLLGFASIFEVTSLQSLFAGSNLCRIEGIFARLLKG